MPSNQVKFKVYAPNYEKLSKTNPSGISYDIRYFVPIYDPRFQAPSSGSLFDVTRSDFLLENGLSHAEWWEQFESTSNGQVVSFDGDKLWLRGSFDPNGVYQYASGYNLDTNNNNLQTGLFAQGKAVVDIAKSDTWKIKPYTPLSVSSTSGAVVGGSYDCVIPGNAGNFSWNKIAIFLAELDVNGNETGNLFLYGMVYSNVRLVKNRLVNNAGMSVSPNFTIRFNVIISGETYDANRYDYLFFTESFWYYLNTDTITTKEKVVFGLYDGAFIDHINKPVNFINAIDGTRNPALSIGGIKSDGTTRYYDEYAFSVDWGSDSITKSYSRQFRMSAYRATANGGGEVDAFGSIVFGKKVQWNASSGLAWDMNDDPNGYGILAVDGPSGWSFGSLAIGRAIHTSGYFNLTYGDGLGVGGDIHYGLQTHGNFNINVGARNRIGSLYEALGEQQRYGYGWLSLGQDNYSQGSMGITFGNCNNSQNGFVFLFGHANLYRNKIHAGSFDQGYGSLGASFGVSREPYEVNNWMIGLYNSINARGRDSGTWGEGAPNTNNFIFGSHNDILYGPSRNQLLFGEQLTLGQTPAYSSLGIANSVGAMFGVRGKIANAPYSHLSLMDTSTLSMPQWSLGIFTNSYFVNTYMSFSNKMDTCVGSDYLGMMVGQGHAYDVYGYNGLSVRKARRWSYANPYYDEVSDGVSDGFGDAYYDYGAQGTFTQDTYRAFDKEVGYSTQFNRVAWFNFRLYSTIATYIINHNDNEVYHTDGGMVDVWRFANPVVELNSPSDKDYHFVKMDARTGALVGDFDKTSRTVLANGVAKQVFVYLTASNSRLILNNTDPYYLAKGRRYTGELHQVVDIKSITYSGETYIGFKLAFVELDGHIIAVPNTQDDRGLNWYHNGCGVALIEPSRVQWARNGFAYGAKARIVSDTSNPYTVVKFVVNRSANYKSASGSNIWSITASPNVNTMSVVVDSASDIYGRTGSLSITSSVRAGIMDHGIHIGQSNVFANTYGSTFVGNRLNHTFTTKNYNLYGEMGEKYMVADLSAQSKYERFNFQRDHKDILGITMGVYEYRMQGGMYDSVFDSWHGSNLYASLNSRNGNSANVGGYSGHTAFTRLFGSHLYIGRDFVDGSLGTSGVMYADLFGYDINVMVRDCGANLYKPQYNIHAHGIHLLVTRSDQFVFGTLNLGDPQNLFEFGAGSYPYQRMREGYGTDGEFSDDAHFQSQRKNGFAFGYMWGSSALTDGVDFKGRYPAFKVCTGSILFGHEEKNGYNSPGSAFSDRVIMAREMYIESGTVMNEGDVVVAKIPNATTIRMSTTGSRYAPQAVTKPDDMERVWGMSANLNDVTDRKQAVGILLKSISANGAFAPVAFKGGPFRIARKLVDPTISAFEDPEFPMNWQVIGVYKDASISTIYYSVLLN